MRTANIARLTASRPGCDRCPLRGRLLPNACAAQRAARGHQLSSADDNRPTASDGLQPLPAAERAGASDRQLTWRGEKLTATRFAQNELAGAAAMPSAVEILYSLTRFPDNPEKHNVKCINALPAPAHPMLNCKTARLWGDFAISPVASIPPQRWPHVCWL